MRHPLLLTVSHSPGDGNVSAGRSRRMVRLVTLLAVTGVALAGCGSVSEAPPDPKAERIELRATAPKWEPKAQVSGDATNFSITITNAGDTVAPNVIVNLQGLRNQALIQSEEEDEGTQAEENLNTDENGINPAEDSKTVNRAAWIVDEAPNGGAIANSDNYTAGKLEPGRSVTIRWRLGAVRPGTFTLAWRISGGLADSQAKATSGTGLTGKITRTITDRAGKEELSK